MKWTDINGQEWNLHEMKTLHLINTIAMIWRVTAARSRHCMGTDDYASLHLDVQGRQARKVVEAMLAELRWRDHHELWGLK